MAIARAQPLIDAIPVTGFPRLLPAEPHRPFLVDNIARLITLNGKPPPEPWGGRLRRP